MLLIPFHLINTWLSRVSITDALSFSPRSPTLLFYSTIYFFAFTLCCFYPYFWSYLGVHFPCKSALRPTQTSSLLSIKLSQIPWTLGQFAIHYKQRQLIRHSVTPSHQSPAGTSHQQRPPHLWNIQRLTTGLWLQKFTQTEGSCCIQQTTEQLRNSSGTIHRTRRCYNQISIIPSQQGYTHMLLLLGRHYPRSTGRTFSTYPLCQQTSSSPDPSRRL